jgi:hypothetical protein
MGHEFLQALENGNEQSGRSTNDRLTHRASDMTSIASTVSAWAVLQTGTADTHPIDNEFG